MMRIAVTKVNKARVAKEKVKNVKILELKFNKSFLFHISVVIISNRYLYVTDSEIICT